MEIILKPNQTTIAVDVKAGARKNEILAYDKHVDTYKLAIKALPEANKANVAIIKFLKKHLKKEVKIIKGLKNKKKVIKFLE